MENAPISHLFHMQCLLEIPDPDLAIGSSDHREVLLEPGEPFCVSVEATERTQTLLYDARLVNVQSVDMNKPWMSGFSR